MADYTPTPSTVAAGALATIKRGTAGATIVAGNILYKDATDSNKLKLADSNAVAAGTHVVEGMALDGGAAGQPISYVTEDADLNPGFVVPIGTTVILSGTPGGMAPDTDAIAGDFVTNLGVGNASTRLNFKPVAAGAAKAA